MGGRVLFERTPPVDAIRTPAASRSRATTGASPAGPSGASVPPKASKFGTRRALAAHSRAARRSPARSPRTARCAAFLAVLVLRLGVPVQAAPPQQDTRLPAGGEALAGPILLAATERVVAWFGVDRGSVSVGTCDGGYLLRGALLPPVGDTWHVLPAYAERRLLYGTDELVTAVARAARNVAQRSPGAVLGVGNLSGQHGGPLRFSASHEAGRDVDVAYYATTADGRPAQPAAYATFDCEGLSTEGPGTYRLDAERNWLLVEALLTDPDIDVQHIFAATCLAQLVRQAGRRLGAPSELLERTRLLMKRPSGGEPHNDHMHVRVFCSRRDLEWGCRNGGGVWDWTRLHEGHYLGRNSRLRDDLRSNDARRRAAALRVFGRFSAPDLAYGLLALARDPRPNIRILSRHAAARAGDPNVVPALRLGLQEATDPAEVRALIRLLAAFDRLPKTATALLLEQVASEPRRVLRLAKPESFAAVRREALRALAFVGRPVNVPGLIALLGQADARERRLIDRALRFITNHAVANPRASAAAQQAAWQAFWKRMRRYTADEWQLQGFHTAGVSFRGPLYGAAAVPPLVAAIARGGHLAFNAQRQLRPHVGLLAPELPHGHVTASLQAWHSWLGSRLPVGALDDAPPPPAEP